MTASTSTTGVDSASQKSTPASSPPPTDMDVDDGVSKELQAEEDRMRALREKEDAKRDAKLEKERQEDLESGKQLLDKKFQQLEFLMNKSKLYANVMLAQMQQQEDEDKARDEKTHGQSSKREKDAEQAASESQRRATRNSAAARGQTDKENVVPQKKGRGRPKKTETKGGKISDFFKKEELQQKVEESDKKEEDTVKTGDIGIQDLKSARQPRLVTGGTMRSYQLEGLEWMLSLYNNGINGILADEMGLGKTIQTISLLAHLWEKQSYGPFLIAAPLSTTSNWVAEFKKWTPSLPVVLYHGDKKEREKIRRTKFKNPGTEQFPIVVTSYEICMNDRKFLTGFGWQFIIIDEGHRIKNLDCRLIRELQQYRSANRLLITGTPLQNNLIELWSLLHFLLPTVFDKLSTFESWFDFSGLKDKASYEQLLSEERQQYLVKSLHAVLKPFLLRRVKTDVESLMPKKREYVLYAPLTPMQRELYQAILDGTSRSYLEEKAIERLSVGLASGAATPLSIRSNNGSRKRKPLASGTSTPNKSAKTSREGTPASIASRRSRTRKNYEEVSDRQYFAELEQESELEAEEELDSEAEEEKVRAATFEIAKRQLLQKKLGNPIMQLRLCCNSPYNFFNPFITAETSGTETFASETEPDETLVSTSGKMLLLDSLLPELLSRGHKVLIFSQFTTTLDLIGQYLALRSHPYARIDGSVAQSDRQEQILSFNKSSTSKSAKNVFILSTRAGGQGINLASADTVILFDSDWNPQQDLQAMDRAHRIGQTRNVIVYRFATRNTVEQKLLESAEAKRRLEKLVIRKGGVRNDRGGRGKQLDKEHEVDELQKLLRKSDGEAFDVKDSDGGKSVLGKKEIEILLDRTDEAYERAEKGLDVGGEDQVFQAVGKRDEGALMEGLRA
ncbi:ISWI chromatin-remodeling complex ATPase ISW2 [Aaosphaeria arxii CBS 175.79]|uniref:ISWI chromatin-remodeling complex ATPase ISW2 n=1 Tax=Aaosphaeria arxii CBS 175.79 TaxID=1450172 RepID=A0A6A5XPN3_9PLEO|nr:ISWI chromatin-remodeling complex ATPase ISW2 [Aaosphaeria arxii CBS 175.79]KAF2014304.1 ISWI chromatin-remodeling complex ATPase ISW2 [Aaosphaeria arxii CBS 175.79]